VRAQSFMSALTLLMSRCLQMASDSAAADPDNSAAAAAPPALDEVEVTIEDQVKALRTSTVPIRSIFSMRGTAISRVSAIIETALSAEYVTAICVSAERGLSQTALTKSAIGESAARRNKRSALQWSHCRASAYTARAQVQWRGPPRR
jgi:hypothetical protein